jgi:hypothetical protein
MSLVALVGLVPCWTGAIGLESRQPGYTKKKRREEKRKVGHDRFGPEEILKFKNLFYFLFQLYFEFKPI